MWFEKSVETGLIGGLGELIVDSQDGLSLGDEEAGEVLGEMAALALIGEEVAVLTEGTWTSLGNSTMPGMIACSAVQLRQSRSKAKWVRFTYFNAACGDLAKLQFEAKLFHLRQPSLWCQWAGGGDHRRPRPLSGGEVLLQRHPAASRAAANSAGSSVRACPIQSRKPLIRADLSCGLGWPRSSIRCRVMPAR